MFKQIYYFLVSLRPKQHIKNSIIYIPLIFSGLVFDTASVSKTILIFLVFSLFVGTTYIINDYKDKDKDKNHPQKKYRPLVSGKLHSGFGIVGAIIVGLICFYLSYILGGLSVFLCFIAYLINTTIYTFFLKKIEIIDIFSIALGFVIRGLIGIFIIQAALSPRFLIMLFFGALRFGFLKRYQELNVGGDIRANIAKYNEHFLEQIISMITAVILIGYALYTFSSVQSEAMIITLPLVAFGIIRYYYNIFFLKKYQESIESIVLHDKRILVDGILYITIVLFILLLK